jgi:DNA-binding NtrC family response regulator
MPSDQKTGTQNEEAVDVIILCIGAETRDMIAYWLKSLPVQTFVAKDGYQANRILRDVPCRLLVTDRLLPPWPGLGRINRLLARQPSFRIAFVDNCRLDLMVARAVGATDFLPWPLTRRSLVDLLARLEAEP